MQTTKPLRTIWLLVVLLSLSFASARAATITNADAAVNLNLGGSWVGGTPAGSGDVAVWNNVVQVNTAKALGANLAWAGIQVLDPLGPITISAGNTLTLGASGIDMSLTTNNLTLACPLVLSANQTWNVSNGFALTVSSALGVSTATSLILTGSGTNNFSAVAKGTYTGSVTVNGGVLGVNSSSGNTTADSALGTGIITNNGATLINNSGNGVGNIIVWNGNCTLNCNNTTKSWEGAWRGAGTVLFTNMIASGNTYTIGGNGSGGDMNTFTGTILISSVNADASATAGNIRFNNGGGNPNVGNAAMTLNLGQGSVHFTEKNSGATTHFGALIGGPNTQLATSETYVLGEANLNTTFAGTVLSTSALNKSGTGVLTLTGNNPNTGTTTVNGGILQMGDGATTTAGALGSGAITVNAAGTLLYNKPDDFTVNNNISGAGNLIKTNVDIMTYGGNNASSGTTTISQGNFTLGAAGLISAPVFVAAGAAFDVTANGAFTLSSTLSGSGTVLGLLTVSSGTLNPGGTTVAGTLTFSNGLTEIGNINNTMELSTPTGTNDALSIIGNLTLNATNVITLSHFGGGLIPNGTYPLINYSGSLVGGLTNFSVTAVGVTGTLTNPPGQIAVIISPTLRGATNLTWTGDGVANNWDTTSTNWINGATRFVFQAGDSATFNDTGTSNPIVNLAVAVAPAAVLVNSANNYTFAGVAGINGLTGLTKTNSGTLSVSATNSYTGPTVIGGGTLEVFQVAIGGTASGIGSAGSSPTNLVLHNGSTLRYASADSPSTDRGITLNTGNETIEIVSGANVTESGTLTGAGSLTKFGPGTLTLSTPNTYGGGTVISNGVLALGANSANYDGAAGGALGATNNPVTFYGGTLQLFGYNGTLGNNFSTLFNPLVVPAGQVGTLRLWPRGPLNSGGNSGLRSTLTGSGTLNLVVNYIRDNLDGNWSAFTGTINVTPKPSGSGDEMRINNNFGYANAAIILNDGVTMDCQSSANATIDIGELSGTSAAIVGVGSLSPTNTTWRVGFKNTSATFAGTISGAVSVTKAGTGTWTLTGADTYTGLTTISNGMLALGDGVTDGSIGGSSFINITANAFLSTVGRVSDGTLTLNAGQTLGGNGKLLGSLSLSGGGTVMPGPGALTVTNAVNLGGGTAFIKINRLATPNAAKLVCSNTITLGGALVVTNTGSTLQVGDTFVLFSTPLAGTFSGSVVLPPFYTWNTANLEVNGTISVTGILPPPSFTRIDASGLAGGTLVFNATGGGANEPFAILTSTNLALPISQWTTVTTGNFDGSGNLTGFSVTVDPTKPQSFYRLQAQ